ncbi:E3 ubiquitin-protein ligase UPL7 [Apostasia shenzhenica]|uniref:HECT-type E3 ubiquitin transferase n=1 Tax=Apostasia shenzhenica TaxID=1088818 RepID=A0A2I0AAS8_9ASPA|nr:E3 ubiquitin-protein ligase UPL7 [Apostasia shenzhenica]
MKKVAEQLQQEWEALVDVYSYYKTAVWLSNHFIRPFLFITSRSLVTNSQGKFTKGNCISTCFKILLQSITTADSEKSFCSLAVGTDEEKSTWFCQSKKLVSLCFSILAECNFTCLEGEYVMPLTALAMRLVVSLTDLKQWQFLKAESMIEADIAVNRLILFLFTSKSGMYLSIRRYLMMLRISNGYETKHMLPADDGFLITASALTLGLCPFHSKSERSGRDVFNLTVLYQQYSVFILTVPYLSRRLPSLLLPALKHVSVLGPCLNFLLVSKGSFFTEMLQDQHFETSQFVVEQIPPAGWALANIIDLAAGHGSDCDDFGNFVQTIDCRLYVQVINSLSQNFLECLAKAGALLRTELYGFAQTRDSSSVVADSTDSKWRKLSYVDLLRPVQQQWHLRSLQALLKKSGWIEGAVPSASNQDRGDEGNLKLIDIVYFYYYMLRIFAYLNPVGGPLPILNVLSFSPGIVTQLWDSLENFIFHGTDYIPDERGTLNDADFGNYDSGGGDRKPKMVMKDAGSKLVNIFQKIAGKSTDLNNSLVNDPTSNNLVIEDVYEIWDVEVMKRGCQGISNDMLCILHLFCAIYAHLLLILDDIEFYEKQVPFSLQQQQKIASALNTFVYNSLIHCTVQRNRSVVDAAIRCLQFLYERDCRHKFCPSSLWVAPAGPGRIPIAAAARAHEAAFLFSNNRDASAIPSMSSVLNTVPHVFPFEERVQMFREFIKMDKASRIATGDVPGSGLGLVEIVIRRDHIVEDAFRQLNSLGSRLKSGINVSFISECGLPEAGLDYGGLSKEFLTDLSKAAFDPQFGLFSQIATSEGKLAPNVSAGLLDNGIEMIEFLGRIVGKALYEGILLDYSFSLVFVQKLLGRYSFLDELSTLDSELYRNLMHLKHYDGDVGELSLDFTVTEEFCGKRIVIELRFDGRNVSVTNENKLQYIHAISDYKLNWQMLPLANAFYRGLTDLISPSWLSLFNANEFNQLLSGGKHDFDVDDLRSNTKYTGGYSDGSRTIKIFWEVLKGFKPSERCMLLKFVTSCSRAPLLGFKHLQPSFTIHKVAGDVPLWATLGGHDVDRLPSASTCYNTLKLPAYKRHSTLRSKLLYAISSNTGFELS